MYLIKRYTNRKLYDTQKKEYLNLDMLAAMIRQGAEVKVIDNLSGEDITTVTLTQIILEQEKKEGVFLPSSILSTLIKTGGESLSTIRKMLISPSDLLTQVEDEISQRLKGLIQRGEIAEETGRKLHAQLIEKYMIGGNLLTITDEDIQESLKNHDFPSREEIQTLINQIEKVTAKLDEL
jgi:polyhydroxyalkanoate synthesis repressor PhaR